jgi:hypothetical protein
MGNSSISGRIALPAAATRRPDALRREGVELRTRLPEVDHAPAIGGRTGRGEDEPVRMIAAHVDCCRAR